MNKVSIYVHIVRTNTYNMQAKRKNFHVYVIELTFYVTTNVYVYVFSIFRDFQSFIDPSYKFFVSYMQIY